MKRKILVALNLMAMVIGLAQSVQEKVPDETLQIAIRDILQLAIDRNVKEIDERYIHPEFGVMTYFE